jgi:hypothetical protein
MEMEVKTSTLESRYDNVARMIHDMATDPVIDDPILQEIYGGIDTILSEREDFRTLIRARLISHPDATTTETGYLISRCIQFELLKENSAYPHEGVPDDWAEKINELLDDPVSHESIFESLMTRSLQTNVPDRYKSVHLIFKWLEANGRLGRAPLWMDIGCSQNFGMKRAWTMGKIDTEGRFDSYSDTEVYIPDEQHQDLVRHPRLTEAVGFLLNQEVRFHIGTGLDKQDMYDPEVRLWAKSCLRPTEISSPQKGSFDYFDNINPKQVTFTQLDVLSEDATQFMEVSSDDIGNYDVVSAVTMAYQLSEPERLKLFEVINRYARPNGVVIIQDFAQLDPQDTARLKFEDDWFAMPYNYRTFIFDKLRPEAGFKEIMHWSSGRCENLVPLNAEIESEFPEQAGFLQYLGSIALAT